MNLPNKISLARILLTPVVLVLFLLDGIMPYHLGCILAAVVFVLAAATDGIDGYIARKYNMVTTLGKFLDSIADKILCSVAMVLILFATPVMSKFACAQEIMIVLVCIHFARDLIIGALRQMAASKNIIIAADMLGKIKANFDYFSIPILLCGAGISALCAIGPIYLFCVGFGILAIATILSVISGVNYLLKYREVFTKK